MPEAITIKEEPTTPLSLEDQNTLQEVEKSEETSTPETPETPELLAGKYKSVEELEKGYQELQQKLGKGETTEEVSESEPEQQEETTSDPREIYGEVIGSKLDEAGIDFGDMNTRWQESGQLTNEDYGALEGAGFTREMVDSYLSGVQFRAAQDSELAANQVMSLKQEFGGEKAYGDMIQWAGQNMNEAEINAFNNMIKTPDIEQIRMALAGLKARYEGGANREPQLIGGKTVKGVRDKFESTAQLEAAMNDEKYSKDPAYRQKVIDKLGRSAIF